MRQPATLAWAMPLLMVLFMLFTANGAFFQQLTAIYPLSLYPGFILSVATMAAFLLLLLVQLAGLLLSPAWLYPVLLMLSATTGYFTGQFGILFDRVMLTNILQTNPAEAADLLSTGLIWHLVIFAIGPCLLLWLLRHHGTLSKPGWQARLMSLSVLLVLTLAGGLLYPAQFASFFREHKSVRYYVTPLYPVYSAIDLGVRHLRHPTPSTLLPATAEPIQIEHTGHKELVVVVVGETARADHFSLNGYARQTNPLLAQQTSLLSYTQVQSCGTSTAVSVPCLFSFSDRESFDIDTAKNTENVLDVLHRAGVSLLWRDNNSDDKGVADRIPYEDFQTSERNPICNPECRDMGMLAGLQEFIDSQTGDILIVLHQMGSHGPAYFKRYPQAFERFTPACQSNELAECSHQEIINAYDNSILYTDYFLNEVIELLKRNTPEFETAMLYMSDHGESLGENGVYLHGIPYFLAPESQTHVPFLVWVGDSSDIYYEESVKLTHQPYSHDDFSCSLLQAFEIEPHALGVTPCVPYFVYKAE
ncbi:phosphoethanolamine transferase [Bowmanella dokdonensis]|uniref:Phosphoethanolamine transferase n=1 Tax=Bowmanella dokdonensis TaxID=751969 RepID=A0A939ISW2_9ALTE|nr:phosphoethanolamine--lipid A transferase [Bowmanella dokdonensis]MBN7826846.1 phosphoethanolamine transferase [Bowmanella dokdonensis]